MERLENTFKKYLIRIMGTRWDVQSHEDRYSEGIPDLSFGFDSINGWIELKQIKNMPKNETIIIKPAKYTPEQINWIRRRGKKGGWCFVFVKVGKSLYFLFSWDAARDIKDGMTLQSYRSRSLASWEGTVVAEELLSALRGGS